MQNMAKSFLELHNAIENLEREPLTTEQYDAIIQKKVEELNAVLIEASIACGMRYTLPRRMVTPNGRAVLIIRAEREE